MLVFLAASLCGCRRIQLEREPVEPTAVKQAESTAKPEAPTAPPETDVRRAWEAADGGLRQGWSNRSLRDTLPICVFSSIAEREKAQLIQKVTKQTLAANSKVVFGVFGPGCLNETCDARPTLQCWVERDGAVLNVHTLFFSFHKDDSTCTSECMEVDSSCETPELPAGKYTVRHGDKSYQLQIPRVLREPCLNRE
jgi:hypothetical protein